VLIIFALDFDAVCIFLGGKARCQSSCLGAFYLWPYKTKVPIKIITNLNSFVWSRMYSSSHVRPLPSSTVSYRLFFLHAFKTCRPTRQQQPQSLTMQWLQSCFVAANDCEMKRMTCLHVAGCSIRRLIIRALLGHRVCVTA